MGKREGGDAQLSPSVLRGLRFNKGSLAEGDAGFLRRVAGDALDGDASLAQTIVDRHVGGVADYERSIVPCFMHSALEGVVRDRSACGDNGATLSACKRCCRKRFGVVVEIDDHHLVPPEPALDAVAMDAQRQVEQASVAYERNDGGGPGKPFEGSKRLDRIALGVDEVDGGGLRLPQNGCDCVGDPVGFHRQNRGVDGSGKTVRHDRVDMGGGAYHHGGIEPVFPASVCKLHGSTVGVVSGDRAEIAFLVLSTALKRFEYALFRFCAAGSPAKASVYAAHRRGVAHHARVSLLDPDDLVAKALHLGVAVGHDEHGHAVFLDKLADAVFAFLLEHEVANRKHLVHYEDLGDDHRGDSERDARHHARGVVLERHVEKLLDLGELHDLVEMVVDELLRIA